MPTLVNWELLKNPLSWIIMFLMVAVAYIGAQLVVTNANQ